MILGEAVMYNIFYEIFSACTSIVGEDESGRYLLVLYFLFTFLVKVNIQIIQLRF